MHLMWVYPAVPPDTPFADDVLLDRLENPIHFILVKPDESSSAQALSLKRRGTQATGL